MELSLVVRRVIRASPTRLFDAWTSASELLAWWGPLEVDCVRAEIDPRVGGRYRLDNALPDGRVVTIEGRFSEVIRPEKLVYSWEVVGQPRQIVSVEFKDHAEGTEVVIVHTRIPDEASRSGHRAGWQGCLDGLGQHVD